ncbi:MAG: ribonuclease H-like domain-containing protein [Gemmatimonadaceae bacterium]|nr:ribonuclease H-like domain-containing protein [Gemmatimonadaceae bacterium]
MLFFDIETIPSLRSLAVPYPAAERHPPEGMSHADTLIQWRCDDEAAWREEWRKEASLSPRLGRVLCMGLAVDDEPVQVVYAYTEDQEREVLQAFWAAAERADGQLCGFNSRPFDVPFVLVRSAIQDVLPRVPPPVVRDWMRTSLRSQYHLDLREGLTGGLKFAKGKLDDWAKFFGGEGKMEGFSGKDVLDAFLRGEHEKIIAYQIPDVEATRFVHDRVRSFFGLSQPVLDVVRVGPVTSVAARSAGMSPVHSLASASEAAASLAL